ncbi:hypothetical protein [Pseudonocardia oroxyli]|nr:hypothetical protein [Pseudonocardia oroxyli]
MKRVVRRRPADLRPLPEPQARDRVAAPGPPWESTVLPTSGGPR